MSGSTSVRASGLDESVKTVKDMLGVWQDVCCAKQIQASFQLHIAHPSMRSATKNDMAGNDGSDVPVDKS